MVNVSNLKDGVYIVKITEEGKTATRKLLIK
ncbi:T9SS type A sorting domain-containing protein [Flavobacterium sp. 38-13]